MQTEYEMTIDARGRITLPKPIRDRLGIRAHGTVVIVDDETGVKLRAPVWTLESLAGSLVPVPGTEHLTIEERIRLARIERGNQEAEEFLALSQQE